MHFHFGGMVVALCLLLGLGLSPAYQVSDPAYPIAYTETQKTEQRVLGQKMVGDLQAALKAKAAGFTINPGVYRVKGTLALDRVLDFTLTAKGVEIIAENQPTQDFMSMFACERVKVAGPLIIDCEPMVFSQGKILGYSASQKTLDVQILAGYRADLNAARFQLYAADGTWLRHGMLSFTNPQKLDAQTVRVTVPDDAETAALYKPGNLIAFEGPGAAFAVRNSNYSFEDITVYGGYNMFAWEDQGIGPNNYLRCKMVRRPWTNRLIGGAGPQQNYASGGPVYDGCEFAYSWDDNINLLNSIHMVYRQESPRSVIVKPSSSGNPFHVGDTASFYRFDVFDQAGSARILSVEVIQDAAMAADANKIAAALQPRDLGGTSCVRIGLDRDLALKTTDYVETSALHNRTAVIRNCYFHDYMCRTMIQGVGSALIENNVIERAGLAGIDVRLDAYWWEGPTSQNVVIRNNTLRDSPYSLYAACCAFQMSGAISVGPSTSPGKIAATGYIFKNIRIEGNRIYDPMFSGILAKNIDSLTIKDNIIVNPVTRSGGAPGSGYYGMEPLGGIFLHAVRNATLTGNRMQASPNCSTLVKVGKYVDMPSLKMEDNAVGPVAIRSAPSVTRDRAQDSRVDRKFSSAQGRALRNPISKRTIGRTFLMAM